MPINKIIFIFQNVIKTKTHKSIQNMYYVVKVRKKERTIWSRHMARGISFEFIYVQYMYTYRFISFFGMNEFTTNGKYYCICRLLLFFFQYIRLCDFTIVKKNSKVPMYLIFTAKCLPTNIYNVFLIKYMLFMKFRTFMARLDVEYIFLHFINLDENSNQIYSKHKKNRNPN